MSIEQKRAMAKQLLQSRSRASSELGQGAAADGAPPEEPSFDMFMTSTAREPEEAIQFSKWVESTGRRDEYFFEMPRCEAQRPAALTRLHSGVERELLNFASFNYLGFSYHPEVIEAAKAALDRYGLGAGGSPVQSGTLEVHKALERRLVEFSGLPDRDVTVFASGFGVNVGVVSAMIKAGHNVVLDSAAHMSIVEGAQLSKGRISYFRHNDAESLDRLLSRLDCSSTRTLVCTEGLFSADGDFGKLRAIVDVAKRYGAMVLVDEAHSMMIAGPTGRGVCEAEGVLEEVDLLVLTLSKALGGLGGAVLARKEISRYISWYSRCRMFSCALDPAVAGGVCKSIELGMGPVGQERRLRIRENARYMRDKLSTFVDVGEHASWIIPVMYGSERKTQAINKFIHEEGLDATIMQYPAVNRDEARVRLFVSSEHTVEQMDRAVEILRRAAAKFGFAR